MFGFINIEAVQIAFFDGFLPVIMMFLVPLLLWVVLPGIVAQLIFKRRIAYSYGALLGLLGLFTIGPL
ncbi:hypothetical protein ACJ2A9_01150 [Anaerobacillus sp. MEB173]|uniref:hypothetical protein n=1 Tax=Anaerobacillus sp. MEB173 TaxID=3383345 RepID=UPI003F8FE92C